MRRSIHCEDCGMRIFYHGNATNALAVHYRVKHGPWQPMLRNTDIVPRRDLLG